jgi:hypothetical protein
MQVPPQQSWPVLHTWPQLPQLLESYCLSLQTGVPSSLQGYEPSSQTQPLMGAQLLIYGPTVQQCVPDGQHTVSLPLKQAPHSLKPSSEQQIFPSLGA